MELPQHLREKAYSMPEYRQGANKVTLVLKDGRRIQHVFLAWGREIVKIEEKLIERDYALPFKAEDILDIVSEIL